jgi:hypothetical protein
MKPYFTTFWTWSVFGEVHLSNPSLSARCLIICASFVHNTCVCALLLHLSRGISAVKTLFSKRTGKRGFGHRRRSGRISFYSELVVMAQTLFGGRSVSEIIGYETQCVFPVCKQQKRFWKICGGAYIYLSSPHF